MFVGTLEEAYRQALRSHLSGQFREAELLYRQILRIKPDHADSLRMLSYLAHQVDRNIEALDLITRAVVINPVHPDYHTTRGVILATLHRLDEAVAEYEQALRLKPDSAEALHNLAILLRDMGLQGEAIEAYRTAVALRPDPVMASHLLYSLHWHLDYDARRIFEEHAKWNRAFAKPLAPAQAAYLNDPSSDRRLRVGFVSPDLRHHPVARFLLPLLQNLDRSRTEVFCYCDVRRSDSMTEELRRQSQAWRETAALSDEQLADLIRRDQIDILVDLSTHADANRLLAFARKPAPVQVTYLSYCSTTGLETMDYRLSDPYLDPPGATERVEGGTDGKCYSEWTIRLPQSYWCYQPADESPPVALLPARSMGYITFGCLNNYGKITTPAWQAWRELLRAVPASRLLIHSREGSHRQRAWDALARDGIEPNRLAFVGPMPLDEYLAQYARIDIALDPFPYPGGTTTCDALWMGVPVVSLAGKTAVSRAGLSILSNIGLPDLVARDVKQYIQIATELAGDLQRLENLRTTLRDRMRNSPLMDAKQFARDFEAALRGMWRTWCEGQASGQSS